MGKLYSIEIKEELSRVLKIEADSLAEAIDRAAESYKKSETVLDYSDYKGTEFNLYEDMEKVR